MIMSPSAITPAAPASPLARIAGIAQRAALPSFDEMYRAVVRRDASYEGVFFTAVKTTGIFCRPGCTAKTPRRENVEFFRTPRECVIAGYRACKRCKPLESAQPQPAWVSTLLQGIEREPSRRIRARDLRSAGVDPARAARWFKSNYGMTFQAYHRARRLGDAIAALRNGESTLDRAGVSGGYASLSGFRDAFTRTFATTPGKARTKQSARACLFARWLDTPLGPMLAIADDEGLCLLEFVDRRMIETQLATLRRRFDAAIVPGENSHLQSIARELKRYFEGDLTRFMTPLSIRGTEFQMKVWKRLLAIPYGETHTYAAMARDIGVRDAQRAVGKANGDNRLAIIIPCHRVIRSDGTLCGYGGGMWRKKWLLEHERGSARA